MANLVSLDEYKNYKKLTKTENDDQLEAIITSVSEMVKSYCGHSFIDHYSVNKIEHFSVEEFQDNVSLSEWPVRDVISVESRDGYDELYETVISQDYYINSDVGCIYRNGSDWPKGHGAVKVTYRGGYASTPADIAIATMDLVTHYWKEQYIERKSAGSASIDNSVKFTTSKWPS